MNKPKLSFWQIWNMSFGFFGIQFGFALQNANVSRIFETLGADKHAIPLLWIAAPLTGLIVSPSWVILVTAHGAGSVAADPTFWAARSALRWH